MPNKKDVSLFCRVCGKMQEVPPWGKDGKCPSYEICSCCGTEFGYGDCKLSAIKESRTRWLNKGGEWVYQDEKLDNWSLDEQLKNIPPGYK